MTCPELIELSRLIDGDLNPDEAARLAAHASECATCGARRVRLERAREASIQALSHAARRAQPAVSRSECLAADAIVAWLDPGVADAERAPLDRHLESCDGCLEEALTAARTMARLDASPGLAVPAALRERVASRWPAPLPERSPLTELVVRIGRAGATLVERRVVAPLLGVIELTAPEPAAVRSDAASAPLRFRIRAPEADISATIVPAGDSVAVNLVLTGQSGHGLGDQRVFLRRHGRSIFSARTDARGELEMPGLERGVYEVACPGIQTEFRLDLRGSARRGIRGS